MESKASLRYARVSARKARLVADLIRGRYVDEALEMLTFTRKKTAPMIKKLIESAVSNAEQTARHASAPMDIDSLFVKSITVDQGPVLRRFRPRAQGRATPVRKATAHISVVLDVRED